MYNQSSFQRTIVYLRLLLLLLLLLLLVLLVVVLLRVLLLLLLSLLCYGRCLLAAACRCYC
jgi:hypothetical protein